MSWIFWVFLLVIVLVLAVKRVALLSTGAARQYLAEGALIVDVRTPEEFKQGHVPGAVNLPLADLPGSAVARFADRNQVLLVHCLAGGRSAVAQRLLKSKGYTRVFNLGSYGRVQRIVTGLKGSPATP